MKGRTDAPFLPIGPCPPVICPAGALGLCPLNGSAPSNDNATSSLIAPPCSFLSFSVDRSINRSIELASFASALSPLTSFPQTKQQTLELSCTQRLRCPKGEGGAGRVKTGIILFRWKELRTGQDPAVHGSLLFHTREVAWNFVSVGLVTTFVHRYLPTTLVLIPTCWLLFDPVCIQPRVIILVYIISVLIYRRC
jgi:hypothetical protein